MTSSTSTNVDAMALSMRILNIRTEVADAAVLRAQKLVPKYLVGKACAWTGKADYFSSQAYEAFKTKLNSTFPEKVYLPFITLAVLSQETFFVQTLQAQIAALVQTPDSTTP